DLADPLGGRVGEASTVQGREGRSGAPPGRQGRRVLGILLLHGIHDRAARRGPRPRVGGMSVYVDPKSLEYLDGTVVDYERGMLNTGIKFKNPRVKKACGCGDSFSF